MEKLIGLLVGAALGLRVLDGQRGVVTRIAYGLVGYDLISRAISTGTLSDAAGKPPQGPQKTGLPAGGGAKAKFEERRVANIEERVSRVHEQMVKGTRDPKVYTLAREVVSKKCGVGDAETWCVPEKDHKAEVTALFNEVRKRVRYTWDPLDYDAFQTPAKTLELRSADCDDYISLLGAMLRSVGYKVRSRVVQTTGNSTWNHIYLVVNVDGRWMPLDASMAMPAGWEVPKSHVIAMKDFEVLEAGVPPKLSLVT